jgi:hypothetical protein
MVQGQIPMQLEGQNQASPARPGDAPDLERQSEVRWDVAAGLHGSLDPCWYGEEPWQDPRSDDHGRYRSRIEHCHTLTPR